MLLWRRNLKYYHYSLNTLPVDLAVIFRIAGLLITIFVPYFISFAMGRFWDEYQIKPVQTGLDFTEALLVVQKAGQPQFKV